jgi:hypothetical protein
MESIHIKTVDPTSQDLLRLAARQGLDLAWERYESQQPQDGFLRSGLSCPFGCLQGPCRIDPFGRGAASGICGIGRDQMVAATILRLCLNGALEIQDLAGSNSADTDAGLARACTNAAMALSRPERAAGDLVRMAVALAKLAFDASGGVKAVSGAFKVGYGVLAGDGPTIAVCGHPDGAFVEALISANKPGRVVSLGDWIPAGDGFLPFVCSSGEAELAVASGRIDLVIGGAAADPAITAICEQVGVSLVSSDGTSAEAAVAAAIEAKTKAGGSDFVPDPGQIGDGTVCAAGDIAGGPLAVIGGADMSLQPMGWLASELPGALASKGQKVAAWGDAALWAAKGGAAVQGIDPVRGVRDAIGAAGNLKGVCFVGLGGCRDLALALGAAASGARVCVATPLPVWGSDAVRDVLTAEIGENGGEFAHFDHPAGADEILAWFGQA